MFRTNFGNRRNALDRVVVTGGAGRLGQLVITELLENDYHVVAVDRVRPDKLACPFFTADLTDAGSAFNCLEAADAVVHLGAIPGPQSHPASETFRNNVLSTFNVAEAAGALGLSKLVFASSVFPLGWVEQADRYWPKYVPVDESHPLTPFEAYGLSKQVGEDICAAASRRSGLSCLSLRIMNVIQLDGYSALPWPVPTDDRQVRFVLWPYVDVRDAARACRLALAAKTVGHEALYIAADDIRFNYPTREMLRQFAPSDIEIRGPLEGRESVISIEKARMMIGYEPQFTWQSPC